METEEPTRLKPQFTIAGLLLITAAIAAVLSLGRLWEERGGLAFAIPVVALPFAFVVEFALRRASIDRSWPSARQIAVRLAVIAVCGALPILAFTMGLSYQMFWWSPCPFLGFLPIAYLEEWFIDWPYATWLVPSIPYLILTAPIAFKANHHHLPIRSVVLLIVATLTTVYWFSTSTSYIGKYQSMTYFVGSATSNAGIIGVLWGLWLGLRNRFNFALVLVWNLILVCWLFWLAYPWLGEYP
jgi:hypothetical protein